MEQDNLAASLRMNSNARRFFTSVRCTFVLCLALGIWMLTVLHLMGNRLSIEEIREADRKYGDMLATYVKGGLVFSYLVIPSAIICMLSAELSRRQLLKLSHA